MSKLILTNGRPLHVGGRLLKAGSAVASGPIVPAGSLTLADFAADLTPFQRVGTSKAVPVHGTCDPGLSSVQVRAVIAVGGAAHTQWATIPASGGAFSGTLTVPHGDWCKLQATDGTNTVTTANRFGVGVIGLLIGQSNMENRPKTAFKSPLGDPRCIEYNRLAQLRRLGNYRTDSTPPPNSTVDVSGYSRMPGYVQQTDARGDGYVYLANQIAQALGCIVCLVERARGGSNIIDWVGLGVPAEDKWKAAADAIIALGGDCEFALWAVQGETNAHTMSTAEMAGHIGAIHQRCLALTGRSASEFHFGVGSLGPGSFNGSLEGEFGNMRAAQVLYGNSTPGAFFAGSAHDGTTVDSVHWNGELHARVGLRNAAALLARFGIGKSGAGPRIVSASYANGFVDFMVQHSGGTALQDGAGGAGAALTGFAFKDAGGSTVTYGATSFPAADRIRVAVNGVPATASYAMMNNPHNSNPADPMSAYVPASVPCDNVPFLYSTGAPLQPCPAINITGS
jgi:hypothetical protein